MPDRPKVFFFSSKKNTPAEINRPLISVWRISFNSWNVYCDKMVARPILWTSSLQFITASEVDKGLAKGNFFRLQQMIWAATTNSQMVARRKTNKYLRVKLNGLGLTPRFIGLFKKARNTFSRMQAIYEGESTLIYRWYLKSYFKGFCILQLEST